jgi:hypothetical protein
MFENQMIFEFNMMSQGRPRAGLFSLVSIFNYLLIIIEEIQNILQAIACKNAMIKYFWASEINFLKNYEENSSPCLVQT